jgi:hypothetical protein
MRAAAAAAWLLLAAPAAAQDRLRLGGFAKDLAVGSRSVLDRRPYWHNLARLQLTADGRFKGLSAYAAYNHEVRHGTYFETLDYRLFDLGQDDFWFEWQGREEGGRTWQRNQGLYRAWAGWEDSRFTLRFGRQRIAWGTGKLWNPTDALNPYVYQSVEREEQRGVDAAYFRGALGDLSQFEVVWAPMDTERDTALLERVRTHVGRADLSLMGGKVRGHEEAWMIGGDFAADLWDGSLHGEAAVTEPVAADAYLRWLLGYEYRFLAGTGPAFLEDVWVLAEVYFNGAGESDPARYDVAQVLSGRQVNLGRDYLGAGLSKEVTPLLTAELYAALNLNDDSVFAGPSVRWNALTDLDLTAGWQWYDGARRSEFGRFHPAWYAQAKAYFGY